MTLREVIVFAAPHSGLLSAGLGAVPAAALALGLSHRKGEGGTDPWRILYALLVYAACVPGMFSATLVGYSLLITRENLLDVSITIYFLPIVLMALTLVIMSRNVDFEEVPGFDKIWGLLGLLAVTFTGVLFVQQTRVVLLFHGSFAALGLFGLALFLTLRASARALLGPGSRARP